MSPTIKSLIATTALLSLATVCSAQVPTPSTMTDMASAADSVSLRAEDRRLSAETVRENVELARNAYADIHPGYTRFEDEAVINAAWDAILARSDRDGGLSVGDFYLEISEVLALIRCDHTKAELPDALSEARETEPVYLPLQWTIVDNRAVVTRDSADGSIRAGDEILSIDGRSIAELQSILHRYIPIDGYNEHVRDSGMAASLEFMGGAVDHFGALLWDVPEVAVLSVASADGLQRTVTLPRVGFSDWKAVAIEASARNFKDAVHLERIGENAAILTVDTFVNYRQPVDPHDLYGPVFEALATEGRDTLILDLRENGGGSSDAASALLSYFIDAPRQQATDEIFATVDHDDYVDYITTWNKRAINPNRLGFKKLGPKQYRLRDRFSDAAKKVKPSKLRFEGDLIALTSRSNSSGSTNLLGQLREVRDVTLIGEQTGGNPTGPTAGTIFFLTLPDSGIRLRVPVIRTVMNVGEMEDGFGLEPDISAPDTVESLRAGTDPALDAALAQLTSKS